MGTRQGKLPPDFLLTRAGAGLVPGVISVVRGRAAPHLLTGVLLVL